MNRKELEARLMQLTKEKISLEVIIQKNMVGNSYQRIEINKLIEDLKEAYIENQILKKELDRLKRNKKTTTSSLRHTKEYKEFRLKILDRDGNKCTQCGSNKKLQIHHKKSVGQYPELALDENNVITLCAKCHTDTDNYLSNT